MNCPSCGAALSRWQLWRLTDWTPLTCSQCGERVGRKKNLQLWLVALLTGLSVFAPLQSAAEGLISWWTAIALVLLLSLLLQILDAATVNLVPAQPKKFSFRKAFLFTFVWIGSMVLLLPVTIYVVGVLPSDCRDWTGTLRTNRMFLRACDDPKQRYYALGDAAKAAAELGQYKEGEQYAAELLRLAPAYRRDWNFGNAIHDGHMVLGRVALARGDRQRARLELLAAGNTPGSPQLDTFGPDMALARDMLRAGERDAVLRYFDECARFWKFGDSRLKRWRTLVRLHLPPDFNAIR